MIIAKLASIVLGWGVPQKFARPFVWIFLIALLVIVLGTTKCAYDKSVIDDHTAKVDLQREKADRKADNAAAEQRSIDDARLVQERQELTDVAKANPDPAVRKREFYKCIRLQQAARANGLEPPACV